MKSADLLTKKKLQKSVESALMMNNASIEYLDSLLTTHDFSDEEKENLGNLRRYLDETLNLFFSKLISK